MIHVHSFDWNGKNEDHIARHGVSTFEVEEAILFGNAFYQRSREGKYIAYAVTGDGRYLFIVFAIKGSGRVRPVTARDMTEKGKRYYRKRKGVR